MENISLQYPSWYIIFCLALGLGYALLLYFRDKTFKDQPDFLKRIMAFFRFLTVSLLSLLLLSPLLKSLITDIKKPVIVIAQDQSESVRANMSEEDVLQYQQSVEQLETAH